jgi:hypothetical protein
VAFGRWQALANKLSKLAETREKSEIAARLEERANEPTSCLLASTPLPRTPDPNPTPNP